MGELACQVEKISEQIKLLELYEGDDKAIAELKKIHNNLIEYMRAAMKMKEAVKRIQGLYKTGEERIIRYIEEGPKEKQEFRYCTYIADNTDFDWSIK